VVYTSEIEKLEQRWAENPKGRNFAPLADAYRKAGELDRALELCKAGLELHPDYVSAHIVFARCLIEQKDDSGASDVFRRVLALDPENVLALKILAEIAARGGRFDEAVEWLGRLLNADPMNGDAAEALTRAKGKVAQSAAKATPPLPAATIPEPVVRLMPEAGHPQPPMPHAPPSPPPVALPDFVVDHASEGPASPDVAAQGTPSDIETFDGTLDFNAVAHHAARADGLEVQEEVELKPQDLVVEGLAHSQYESGTFAMLPEVKSDDAFPTIDLPLIMPDDVDEPAPAPLPEPVVEAAPPPAPPAPQPPPPPAAVALSDDDGAADTAALSRAEPMLTETMAELYLRQGHQEEGLRVYQALLSQRPADTRLRARVTSLVSGGRGGGGRETGETVQVFLRRILAGRPGMPAAEPPSTASGSPLDGAFASAQPDAEPDAAFLGRGEATRAASDNISLDQVFGDEGPRRSTPTADRAGPVPETAVPGAPPGGGFSFDQFFSPSQEPGAGGGGGPAPAEGGTAPRTSGRPSGAALRPSVEDEGELDQFQAWLRGLKS
jgi:tetratricopeptide (TPR) repeat protein